VQDGGIFGVFEPRTSPSTSASRKARPRPISRPSSRAHQLLALRGRDGDLDWNAFKQGCGPVAFSGDLKPGSVIHAKLKGQGEGYPNKDGSKNVYKWDADVTATVRAKP
jgi:hypothetical protein